MHAILKKVNDKFVIEWNKDNKPTYFCENGGKVYQISNEMFLNWQQNTKLIDFASESELDKLFDYLFKDKPDNYILPANIDVSDCVEVKESLVKDVLDGMSEVGLKAYFKQTKESVNYSKSNSIEPSAFKGLKNKKEVVTAKDIFEELKYESDDKLLNTFSNHCLQQGITFKHSNQISEVVTNFLKL